MQRPIHRLRLLGRRLIAHLRTPHARCCTSDVPTSLPSTAMRPCGDASHSGRVPRRPIPATTRLSSDGRRLELDASVGLLAACSPQPLRHATPRLVGPPFILVEGDDRQPKLTLYLPHARNGEHPLPVNRWYRLRHAIIIHVVSVHAHRIGALIPCAAQRFVALHHPQIPAATIPRLRSSERINPTPSTAKAGARVPAQSVAALT